MEKDRQTEGAALNIEDLINGTSGCFGWAEEAARQSEAAGALPSEAASAPAYELPEGMSAEEMAAAFFDADALKEPPVRLWQLNTSGGRYYYRIDEEGAPVYYPSVTTVLASALPKPEHLVKWIAGLGYDAARAYTDERAAYGTLMHAEFEELIITRRYDFGKLRERVLAYMERKGLPASFVSHCDELKKDIMAFAQWLSDYDVRPVAVEVSLASDTLGVAGMVDLACTMKRKPSAEERVTAIVDFKSGKHGFHEENELQLHMYRALWAEAFPSVPVERVFNFAPKDWRVRPSYSLKDQTGSAAAAKLPALLELARLGFGAEKKFTEISGTIDLDKGFDASDNVLVLTLEEVMRRAAYGRSDEEGGVE